MLEYCCECGEPTGGAGRHDDSIYIMIARNPGNHDDQAFVARQYFEENFEEIPE